MSVPEAVLGRAARRTAPTVRPATRSDHPTAQAFMPPALPAPPPSGLHERAAAIAQLERWLADATTGRGRFAFVEGETGVGKTSLLHEFVREHLRRDRPSGYRLVWAGCDPLATPRPLAPLDEIVPVLG